MSNEATIWVDIKSLKLWDKNPNQGDIGRIMHSISTHGFNDTCHLWCGIVKAGNHSIMALTNLRSDGWHPDKCKVPSGCLHIDNGTWHVAMLDISEMSDIQSDAFGIAINRTQRLGHDDPVAMLAMLEEIKNSDVPLQSTGYDADDMDELAFEIAPHFEPVDASEQPRLDELMPIICPHCGKDIRKDD